MLEENSQIYTCRNPIISNQIFNGLGLGHWELKIGNYLGFGVWYLGFENLS
jgi:hypothetical protein